MIAPASTGVSRPDVEVIVVDNARDDDSLQRIVDVYPDTVRAWCLLIGTLATDRCRRHLSRSVMS